MVRSSGNKLG